MKRYEVRWVNLDPTAGAEMAKTRPAVIVSLDRLNAVLPTVTICPVTSQRHPGWRTRLPIRLARRDAEVAADQIRTVSKTRLGRRLGTLTDAEATELRRMLTELYGA
jgi:mRNA interferase MazF